MPKNSYFFSKKSTGRKRSRRPARKPGELSRKEARIILPVYIERMVECGRKIPLAEAVRKATKALGLGQSVTAQDRWRAHVRATAGVVFSRERVGRSWVIFIRRTPEVAAEHSMPTFPFIGLSHPQGDGNMDNTNRGGDTKFSGKRETAIPPKLRRMAWGLARTWLADESVLDGYCRDRLRCPVPLVARYIGRWLREGFAIPVIRGVLRRRLKDHACLASIKGSRSWLCSGALADTDRELRATQTPNPEKHRGQDPGVTFLSPQFASSGNQARAKVEVSGPKQTSTRPPSPASDSPPADPMQQWAAAELERIWPHLVGGATSAWERLARLSGFLSPEEAARVDGLRC